MNDAIVTTELSKSFGRTKAVDQLTLKVPEGAVFALLGSNGAGKTTTIKTLLNLLRPDSGRAETLGVDSRRLSPRELRQIGYVSEDQAPPDWMRVGEFLAYCKPLYPTWDDALCAKLLKQFELPPATRLRELSRGTKVKLSLLSSLAYRPRLLLLDEPFAGLDPLTRDELIQGTLELSGSEGWTVFLSSHDSDEVERLADHVGFLDKGSLSLSEGLEELLGRFRKVELTCDAEIDALPALPESWLLPERQGRMLAFFDSQYAEDRSEELARSLFPGAAIAVRPLPLREVFVTLSKTHKERARA